MIRELARYEKLDHEAVGTADDIRRHLFGAKPAAEVILAEVGGEPVGFALYFTNFSTFRARPGIYLEDLFVRPEHRGRGIGKALIAAVARVAVARDAGRLEWAVLNWNTPAIDFYRSLGAEPMTEWTVNRVTDAALTRLADSSPLPLTSRRPTRDERRPLLPAARRPAGRVCPRRATARRRDHQAEHEREPVPPFAPGPRSDRRGLTDRLRLYPDPVGTAFRRAAAELHGVDPA